MDRQNDEVAAAIFEQFIPQTKIRKTCLVFLADSILIAHRFKGDRWGVTLDRDVVRLNVGKPEALCIFPGYLHVVLDIDTLRTQVYRARLAATLFQACAVLGYR